MKKGTRVVLLGAAVSLAPFAASADAVAVALSASFAPPVAEAVTLDVVASGTVPGQTITMSGSTGTTSFFGLARHSHTINLSNNTKDTEVTVTGTATGMINTGQGPLTSLSVAASKGDSAAATAASTQGATTASAAATGSRNRVVIETDFDGRSEAYESEILILAEDERR